MNEIYVTETLPIIALRGLSVFPEMTMHFDVGREKSVRALDEAMRERQYVFLVAQSDITEDDPGIKDLRPVGTVAYIKQVLKIPGDLTRILVEGKYRAQITEMIQTAPYLRGHIESIPDTAYPKTSVRAAALMREAYQLFEQYEELVPKLLPEYLLQIMASQNPGYIADFIAQNSTFHYQDKQQVLEQRNPLKRLELVCRLLTPGN